MVVVVVAVVVGGGSRSGAVPEGLACATKDSTQLRLVPLTSISALTDYTHTHTHRYCTHPDCSVALIVTASLADRRARLQTGKREIPSSVGRRPHVGKWRPVKDESGRRRLVTLARLRERRALSLSCSG